MFPELSTATDCGAVKWVASKVDLSPTSSVHFARQWEKTTKIRRRFGEQSRHGAARRLSTLLYCHYTTVPSVVDSSGFINSLDALKYNTIHSLNFFSNFYRRHRFCNFVFKSFDIDRYCCFKENQRIRS